MFPESKVRWLYADINERTHLFKYITVHHIYRKVRVLTFVKPAGSEKVGKSGAHWNRRVIHTK
jgi:hypothetical protein